MSDQSMVTLHTGRTMPVLGLGTWQLTDDTAGTVEYALQLGYRMIDTAVDYYTQPGIGEALQRTDLDRDRIFLVTKIEEDEDAYDATVRDLRELRTEYADLMLIHRPPDDGPGVHLWEGLIRAKKDGLAREIGVSNYSIHEMDEIIEATGEVPVVNQIEWSPFGWSRDMLDYCREQEIVIQSYSPLTRTERLGDDRVGEIARRHDKTPAQIVLRWDVQMGVSTVPKANRREHLEENLQIFDFELDDADMRKLNALNEQWSSLGRTLLYL